MAKRPTFSAELGSFFREARDAKGWSLRQTATIATNKRIKGVSYQALQRLESGMVKNPEPELLKALATIYNVPYRDLVNRWVGHVFGLSDPIGQTADQKSESSSHVGDFTNDSVAARLVQLERRNEELTEALAQVQNVAGQLAKIAAVGVKDDETADAASKTRRRHRKAG